MDGVLAPYTWRTKRLAQDLAALGCESGDEFKRDRAGPGLVGSARFRGWR
mgnify:CR=1 FL=1